ncbi:tripartite ATP-independent transporter solute receptor, DctP family [Dethiosulfatibacter aminovorans DSM 17477]|uniref:Tripartite ATP-independent transporter solute receptor, DctP family n=1 Tax=Dethiosulfatibacter aminovorans DSM 17477 TaxID=1121476 RepID=A0A1M6DR96_9FIRM|nr:TRAP transporter substrate-binding protein [Dethiosulfatibacter aminovorans]SHI75715.1 tripartite ATP-independent transporter solute receptor, DctP family [Dethiosulfatibacter aminovorans DSM 17477]
MFWKKSICVNLLIMFMVLICLGGCQSKEPNIQSTTNENTPKEPVIIKMGTKMSEESIEGQGFKKFAELVEERTKGEIIVQVYPSEQLGDAMTQLDNLQLGTQDIYCEGAAYLSRYDKDFGVESIPFLFKDHDTKREFYYSEIGQKLSENLIENGLKIINDKRNFIRGPYNVIVSKKPIKSIEDVKGLRLRTFDSEIYMKAWDKLGANPIVIAWTEAYLALKQNTVDAVTAPISLVYNMKFTEVAPYVTTTNEFRQDVIFIMNNDRFESFTEVQRQIIIDSANDAGDYVTEQINGFVESEIERMKSEHNAEFYEMDTEPFREILVEFYQELEDKGEISEGILGIVFE